MRNFKIIKIRQILIIVVFTILTVNSLTAQNYLSTEKKSVYFGIGLGINDSGLGLGIEVPISNKFSGFVNLGIGGWGYKYGFGAIFYTNQAPYGSAFSLGYSVATGLKGFETELYTEPFDESEMVKLDLNNVGTINIIYSYSWTLGRKGKFSLYTGYAIPVTNNAYEVKSTGIELNEDSEQILEIMQPGGLILGLRFMF